MLVHTIFQGVKYLAVRMLSFKHLLVISETLGRLFNLSNASVSLSVKKEIKVSPLQSYGRIK